MNKEKLKEMLVDHKKWLDSKGKIGSLANFRGANFRGANFEDADFRGADFRDADLRYANLRDADLGCANFRGANFGGAILENADFRDADLRYVIGNGQEIKSLQICNFPIVFTKDVLFFGCIQKKIKEWVSLEREKAIMLYDQAAYIWDNYRDIIIRLIEKEVAK
jgi:hypothetical protein